MTPFYYNGLFIVNNQYYENNSKKDENYSERGSGKTTFGHNNQRIRFRRIQQTEYFKVDQISLNLNKPF